jgi:hypothetical protein
MGIVIKTFNNLIAYIKAKFNNVLPGVDPSINGGTAQAIAVSAAVAGYALQDPIQDAIAQSFVQTQDDAFLGISAGIDNCPQLQPTAAIGYCAVGGTLNTAIPINTNLPYLSLIFQTQQPSTVNNYTGSIGTLAYNANGTVQATCSIPHTLSSGLTVTITGASQNALNGTYTITVIDQYNFTYTIGTSLGLITDSGSYSAIYALLYVQCTTTGSATNVGAGSALSINVSGVNSLAYVGINGLQSGTDLETLANWRTREMQAHNNTPGVATTPMEISSLKKVNGITRIWVIPTQNSVVELASRGTVGYYPILGETLIYVVGDNNSPTIAPTPIQLAACLSQLQSDGLLPNWIPSTNIWIIGPTLVTPYISIHLAANNTTSLQTAIANQLAVFFQENSNVGYPPGGNSIVSLKSLLSFLQNVQDPNTGLFVGINFTFNGWGWSSNSLSSTSDLAVSSGQLPIAGKVAAGTIIFN